MAETLAREVCLSSNPRRTLFFTQPRAAEVLGLGLRSVESSQPRRVQVQAANDSMLHVAYVQIYTPQTVLQASLCLTPPVARL